MPTWFLPINPNDSKHEQLAAAVSSYQADAVAFQEIGLNFSHCGIHRQWKSRMAYNKWFDSHSVFVWNKTNPHCSCCQWGGTGIMAVGPTTHYIAGSGVDPTSLEWWCWMCVLSRVQWNCLPTLFCLLPIWQLTRTIVRIRTAPMILSGPRQCSQSLRGIPTRFGSRHHHCYNGWWDDHRVWWLQPRCHWWYH